MRNGFTIHHNGPDANCLGRPHTRCIEFWASVVRYHTVDKGWSGVAYSFGVCPHGVRFGGQGWDRRQFANGDDEVGTDDGRDSEWYTVLVFLGWHEATGVEEQPTPEMVQGVADLIAEGRRTGRCARRVTPHNFWKRKRCPGHIFTALARDWDNAPLTIPDMYLQEDDMTEAEVRAVVRSELQRALAFLTTGAGNQLTGGQDWVPHAVTLPKLAAAVTGQPVATVDVDALAEALAEKDDALDLEQLKAALREVFADAGSDD